MFVSFDVLFTFGVSASVSFLLSLCLLLAVVLPRWGRLPRAPSRESPRPEQQPLTQKQ